MTASQPWPADKRETFRALHEKTLVMPNPWDRGSTRILASLGFPALANTSAGFANSLGRHDGRTTRDEAIAHAGEILDVTDLPGTALRDEAVVLGPQRGRLGEDVITAHEIADHTGTISWECLTSISRRVPRFYKNP